MPRRALALALTLGAAPASAAPADRWVNAGALAGDAALSDLARGQRGPALRQLEARLRAAQDPADRAALSCLIGAVLAFLYDIHLSLVALKLELGGKFSPAD